MAVTLTNLVATDLPTFSTLFFKELNNELIDKNCDLIKSIWMLQRKVRNYSKFPKFKFKMEKTHSWFNIALSNHKKARNFLRKVEESLSSSFKGNSGRNTL